MKTPIRSFSLLVAVLLCAGLVPTRAALVLQLDAANFNDTTGVWTDTSGTGNNATWETVPSTRPFIVEDATPNGSMAIEFQTGFAGYMNLTNPIDVSTSSGFTILTFVNRGTGAGSIIRDSSGGGIELRLKPEAGANQYKLNLLRSGTAEYGLSDTPLAADTFYNANITGVFGTGGTASFRLDGAADGTINTVTVPTEGSLDRIGGAFSGQIAAIYVYDEVLSLSQIQAIETQFYNAYVVPEPATGALLAGAGLLLFSRRSRSRRGCVSNCELE